MQAASIVRQFMKKTIVLGLLPVIIKVQFCVLPQTHASDQDVFEIGKMVSSWENAKYSAWLQS